MTVTINAHANEKYFDLPESRLFKVDFNDQGNDFDSLLIILTIFKL